jgi:hypothetical protein
MAEGSVLLLLTSSELAKSLQKPVAGFVPLPVTPGVALPSMVVRLERRGTWE